MPMKSDGSSGKEEAHLRQLHGRLYADTYRSQPLVPGVHQHRNRMFHNIKMWLILDNCLANDGLDHAFRLYEGDFL